MLKVLLILVIVFFVVPVVAYMVMKFGTAGYLMAKRRDQQKQQTKDQE